MERRIKMGIDRRRGVSLEELVSACLNYISEGLGEARRGNEHEATISMHKADALFGMFCMEYNSVLHDWPIDLSDNTKDLIRHALKKHEELIQEIVRLNRSYDPKRY